MPAERSRGSDPVYLGKTVSIWGLDNAGEGITGIKRNVSFFSLFTACAVSHTLLECWCWAGRAPVHAFLVPVGLQNGCCNEIFLTKNRKSCKRFSSTLNFCYTGDCIPSLVSSHEGDLTLRHSSNRIRQPVPSQPPAPTRDPVPSPAPWHPPGTPEWCDAAAALLRGLRRERETDPPTPHKPQTRCSLWECQVRFEDWQRCHSKWQSALIPSPEIKHTSGHRRLFSLLPTVPAVVWLCRTSQPLQKHFWCQGNGILWKHFPLRGFFCWSLKPEIKGPASWSLLLQVQLHLLGFWYRSKQDSSSFCVLWLNLLHSLSFRNSQMSQLTPPWHIFQGKKDVKKAVTHLTGFFSCYSAIIVLINTEENWHNLQFSSRVTGHVQLQFAGWYVNFVDRWPLWFCLQFWPALFHTHFTSRI